ncbi:MAG: hypothetical protein JSS93_10610 [Bacteroidetes bacterium]|nr:hypothetical protein [Bacteroidota bacterium]
MKPVYNSNWLHNLTLVKEANRWQKQGWITHEQFDKISLAYPSSFYHPNLFIRVLLFVATLIALSGLTGLLGLVLMSTGQSIISGLCILYGIISWFVLETIFVRTQHHYKSGVNEALLYHSAGFIMVGIAGLADGNLYLILALSILIFAGAAIRFVDLVSTVLMWGCLGFLIFYSLYKAGEEIRQGVSFVMIIAFSGFYFLIMKIKEKKENEDWENCFIVSEVFCLLTIYAAGNYFVVRELQISMMNLSLQEGEDIPLARLFYFLTVILPLIYLYFGIQKKNIVLIRVSLVVLACAVFTFKYYFSLHHHEITLTIAGIILLGIAGGLFRYLKTPRHGYTAENILSEKGGSTHLSAFLISQTLGGNKAPESAEGGGSFGGGGSTDRF